MIGLTVPLAPGRLALATCSIGRRATDPHHTEKRKKKKREKKPHPSPANSLLPDLPRTEDHPSSAPCQPTRPYLTHPARMEDHPMSAPHTRSPSPPHEHGIRPAPRLASPSQIRLPLTRAHSVSPYA